MVSIATQKFIAEIASDALQLCKARQSAVNKEKRDKQQKDKLSKENVLFSVFSPNGRWIKVAVRFSFLLFLIVVYLGSGWKSSFWTLEPSHFTIILDCGSTGTRVHVYEWSHDNRKVQEKFQIVVHSISGESAEIYGHENGLAYLRVQTEPGLDKFLHNESGLRASIEPLLNWAEQHIPSDAKWILDKACGLHRASSLPELSSSANKTDLEPGLHYYFVHPSTNNCPMVKYSPCF